jgi:hypothetical protein
MPQRGKLKLIAAYVLFAFIIGPRILISGLGNGGINILLCLLFIAVTALFIVLLRHKPNRVARFFFAILMGFPAYMALMFFPYGSLQGSQYLMLMMNIFLAGMSILVLSSRDITLYMNSKYQA